MRLFQRLGAHLLNVLLDASRDAQVDHLAHVPLVDAHPERHLPPQPPPGEDDGVAGPAKGRGDKAAPTAVKRKKRQKEIASVGACGL